MMRWEYGFVGAAAVTLFPPTFRYHRAEPICSIAPSKTVRISSSVVHMKTTNSVSESGSKPTSQKQTKSRSNSKNTSNKKSSIPTSADEDTDIANEYQGTENLEQESLLEEPEDGDFLSWDYDNEESDIPVEDIFGIEEDPSAVTPSLDDEIVIDSEFDKDDELDPDEDDEDNDDDDEDNDDDEEMEARTADEFDEDMTLQAISRRKSRTSPPSKYAIMDEPNEDDDLDDEPEEVGQILEPIDNDLDPIFNDNADDESGSTSQVSPLALNEDESEIDYDEQSEEELQNAANILSDKGLLGLGVERGARDDMAAVKDFAYGEDDETSESTRQNSDKDDFVFGLDEEDDFEDEDVAEEEEEDLAEVEKDDAYAIMTKSGCGRIWELNEDTYVTITEPGQSYAYELDEEDEEDQEMSTMRRGKQGGWSGGLASYPASNFPEGSKEWLARRSYELLGKATAAEMFQWTRRRRSPPSIIADLYPDDPPAPQPLKKTVLKISSPQVDNPTVGVDSSKSKKTSSSNKTTISYEEDRDEEKESALERSIKFPCQYKFKVEGSGDHFLSSIKATVEKILKRPVADESFEVGPQGRYTRVVIIVHVNNAKQVTELYDALRNNPNVKYSFG